MSNIEKLIYLGSYNLSKEESEITYYFNKDNRLYTCKCVMDWEFDQIEKVRCDVLVMLAHNEIAAKYKNELDKSLFEPISLEECREKIKLKREGGEEDAGDDKPITDTEIFAYIKAEFIDNANYTTKIKVITDLIG